MRCYFLEAGRIRAVEVLTVSSDEDAIAKSLTLFSEREGRFDGFEVWDTSRFVYRHPFAHEPTI